MRVTKFLFYHWALQYDPITLSQDILYQSSNQAKLYVEIHET